MLEAGFIIKNIKRNHVLVMSNFHATTLTSCYDKDTEVQKASTGWSRGLMPGSVRLPPWTSMAGACFSHARWPQPAFDPPPWSRLLLTKGCTQSGSALELQEEVLEASVEIKTEFRPNIRLRGKFIGGYSSRHSRHELAARCQLQYFFLRHWTNLLPLNYETYRHYYIFCKYR